MIYWKTDISSARQMALGRNKYDAIHAWLVAMHDKKMNELPSVNFFKYVFLPNIAKNCYYIQRFIAILAASKWKVWFFSLLCNNGMLAWDYQTMSVINAMATYYYCRPEHLTHWEQICMSFHILEKPTWKPDGTWHHSEKWGDIWCLLQSLTIQNVSMFWRLIGTLNCHKMDTWLESMILPTATCSRAPIGLLCMQPLP